MRESFRTFKGTERDKYVSTKIRYPFATAADILKQVIKSTILSVAFCGCKAKARTLSIPDGENQRHLIQYLMLHKKSFFFF